MKKTQKIFEAHRTMVLVSNVESKYSSLSKHGKSLKYASCSMCCYVFHFFFSFIYPYCWNTYRKNSHGTTTTITTTQTTTTKNEKKMCETIELTFLDNKITDQNDFNGTKIIRVAAVWMHSGCFRKWKKRDENK